MFKRNFTNYLRYYIEGNNYYKKNSNGKIIITLIGLFIIILISILFFINAFNNNNVEAVSKMGSNGDEVKQIQEKLRSWGYYSGQVDGIYGSNTESAVKAFQRKNGLQEDGIAGEKTLEALGIQSSNTSEGGSSSGGNQSNIDLLARVIYGESRSEPYDGQVAVGAVIMNRLKHSSFPNTISGIVYQSGAFDAVSDGQVNMEPDESAKKAAQDAYNGWDPSNGAIYYFNPNTATNKWIWSRPMTVTIGKHRFCK